MSNTNVTPSSNYNRDLKVKEGFKLSKFLVKWEMILVYILIAVNIVLLISRPSLYNLGTLQSIVTSGMDLSFMVLGMVLILMLGDIDVSISSIMILSGMTMGLLYQSGIPAIVAILAGIVVGGLCGLFNGFLVGKIGMPAVIVTIAGQSLYRGIAQIILGENTLKQFPKLFTDLYWKNVANLIPLSLICFLIVGVLFCVLLHKSTFGRKLYMMGNSMTASHYSGVNVAGTRMAVFTIMGVMTAISAMFFVGHMGGGLSSSMGTGYELDVIAICVLGGVSTAGGKGKMYGPIIATVLMAFLNYTTGLMGADSNIKKIISGAIMIIAVLIPMINRRSIANAKLKLVYHSNKNIEALNIKTAAEIKELKAQVKSGAITSAAAQQQIATLKAECKATCDKLWAEQKEDAAKAKERFK